MCNPDMCVRLCDPVQAEPVFPSYTRLHDGISESLISLPCARLPLTNLPLQFLGEHKKKSVACKCHDLSGVGNKDGYM